MGRKVLIAVAVVFVVLLAIGGFAVCVGSYDPMTDMRVRADALPIPGDFVLVSESYRGRGFNSGAELERVYHASWPGLCDSLRSIQGRAGDAFDMGKPRGYEGRICFYGAWYPAGGPSRFRNIRHYDLRLFSADGARDELTESRRIVEAEIGKNVRHLAYPFGGRHAVGEPEFRIAQACGFDTARSSDRLTPNLPNASRL
jgi:hypothetical protein